MAATTSSGRLKRLGLRLWRQLVWWTKTLLVVVLLVASFFFDDIVHEILPGHRAVLWKRFGGGTVTERSFAEGTLLTWPWDKLYVYDLRDLQSRPTTVVYAQDGLEITVNMSVRFHLLEADLPLFHKEIGPNFVDEVIVPETTSTLRKVLGNYTPEMIYAKDELGLLDELRRTLEKDLDPRFFALVSVLVLDLRLPEAVEAAIQAKLAEEQQMLSYKFRLEREELEKIRRTTEAEGIHEFEAVSGLSILKWRGIEATEKLATSANSKVILMGSGDGQLPVILGADAPAAPAAPGPGAGSAP
ncbi:prohibitin family protein [Nannocystis punicea]|uniref:Prohibitin family protein n=1 Tax=Nannocystis punicea TaxID=2995304 RepID=A0ABY7GX36_9BACT|nr:prohibitin family protein [Nannocystis poenicansa]WAS91503.1 prohibitin family protein [Nannocystis poenicansa]